MNKNKNKNVNVNDILIYLQSLKKPNLVEGGEMVYLDDIKKLAKEIGKDHSLADKLWKTNDSSAKHLAIKLTNYKNFNTNLLDDWVKYITGWGSCDDFCGNIVCFTEYASKKVFKWADSDDLYTRRAAFATICYLSLKKCKKTDAELLPFLPLIEKYADDDRDHVKKAVNWAIRSLGKRNPFFQKKILALIEKLSNSNNKTVLWNITRRMNEVKNKKF